MVEEEAKYVDVNVFVYWLVDSEYTKNAKYWIEKIQESKYGEFFTSVLTIYETAVIIAGLMGESLRNENFVKKIIEAFKSLKQLKYVSLSKEDIFAVVDIMKNKGLDMEDAIHYLAANKAGAKTIISNDSDFDRTELTRKF